MANNSKDAQLIELKDTISKLNKLIETLQTTLDTTNELLKSTASERDNYKEQVEALKKRLFGSSSEKRNHDIEGQMSLFDEFEVEACKISDFETQIAAMAQELEEDKKSKPRKKKSNNEERFRGIPAQKVILQPDSTVCPECGSDLIYIGEELVRRELEYTPAKFKVIEYYSANYKCPTCEIGENKVPIVIKGKDGKAHMLYGMASSSTIAWVIYQKFVNSVPLYRQEKDWKSYGVDITRATLASWVIKNSKVFFLPFYEYLRQSLLKRGFLMADETPVQVLKEPDKRAESKSYMWLFRTGEDNGVPIILYKYSPSRAGDTAYNFLEGYNGYLMCDGYSGYNKVPQAKRLACWAHIRRYLLESVPKSQQYDYSNPAVQGVIYCDKLFDIERKIKQRYKTPEAIQKARVELESPVLTGFWSWFESLSPKKNTKLDRAKTYIQNRRDYLEVYLEDGRCSFSNNLSENAIRPFTVGRKNWLFSDTQAGAESSAVMYSIIETAKANGVNVYHYLTLLLEKLPHLDGTDESFESLCPWNESVKEEVETRIQNSMK